MTTGKFSLKDIDWRNHVLPYVGALVAGIVVLCIYFNVNLKGEALYQHDNVQSKGMSKEITDHREKYGEEALWTNSAFGGMPAYQISVLYPGNWAKTMHKVLFLGFPGPIAIFVVMFIGFFILLISMKMDPWISAIGALAYTFSSYFFIAIEAGHNTKILACALVPPVIGGILLAYRGKYFSGGALAALFTAMFIAANHLQITYYFLFGIGCLTLSLGIYAIIEGKIIDFAKASGVLLIAGIIGVGPNLAGLKMTLDYGKDTMRGGSELTKNVDGGDKNEKGLQMDYAFRWSYGIGESFTLLVPGFMGKATSGKVGEGSESYAVLKKNFGAATAKKLINQWPTYWGDQPFTSGPVYVGAFICFLFILGLLIVEPKHRWWLLAATLISIIFAWGKNFGFNHWMFEHFPYFDKFRNPAMSLVLAEFTMPLLGFLALWKIIQTGKEEGPNKGKSKSITDTREILAKKVLYTAGGLGGFLLLMVLAGSVFFDFSTGEETARFIQSYGLPADNPVVGELVDALIADRISIFRTDSLLSLLWIVLGAGALWAYLKGKINQKILYPVIAVVILADMWYVDKQYLNDDNFQKKSKVAQSLQPSAVDQQILQDPDPDYRVLNLAVSTFNDGATSYFHKSIGGYHGAKLQRYQDVIDRCLSQNINQGVLAMLNTKYVIQRDPQSGEQRVTRNPAALGHGWYVSDIKWVKGPDEEIGALETFKPNQTAIVDEKFRESIGNFQGGNDSLASLKLTSYKANHLVYESSASRDQIAVFSEIYYNSGKGWKAYLDGQPVPHFRANYILRGMKIPAGKHTIDFKFEPQAYYTWDRVSLVFSILLVLGAIAGFFFEYRKAGKRNDDSREAQSS